MENEYLLSELNQGNKAKVLKIELDGNILRRIRDLGLIEGTIVECLQKSPLGDPTAYLIRGAVIAIRSEVSSMIKVCCI